MSEKPQLQLIKGGKAASREEVVPPILIPAMLVLLLPLICFVWIAQDQLRHFPW
jgi:hypothetical protein